MEYDATCINPFSHCYKEIPEAGQFIKKRGLIVSQFHRLYRKYGWGGLRKLTIMMEGKGGGRHILHGWKRRKSIKGEMLHTLKQPDLPHCHKNSKGEAYTHDSIISTRPLLEHWGLQLDMRFG